MALLAGIWIMDGEGENLSITLDKMLQAQKHRDGSQSKKIVTSSLAMGMSNRHDSVFLSKDAKHADALTSMLPASRLAAVVDGIVLNGPTIQSDLEACGMPRVQGLCSAVVAAAYEKWGLDFMEHLDGEFSCAVWDEKAHRLILARDPYGHKPLHYWSSSHRFLFSSEIKGILRAGISFDVDPVSLSDFLSLNCIPYPATIFKGISQVPPGSMTVVDRSGVKTRNYWHPNPKPDHSLTLEDAKVQLSDALRDAVRMRMVSKETFCFLSGGIDSSAVVSFASEVSSRPIHTVSVGFEEEEMDELEDAAVMAEHIGSVHHTVVARPDSFFDMLNTIVYHHDSPFTDTSSYPTYYAAKLAGGLTNIILTGDGPDQAMGGSAHHVFAVEHDIFSRRNRRVQSLLGVSARLLGMISTDDPTPSHLSKIKRKLYRDSLSPVHAAYDLRSYFPNIVKKFLCTDELWEIHERHDPYRHPEAWFKEVEGLDDINKYLFADIKFYVPDDLMVKVDRMCMAHGLETLSPFQDKGLSRVVSRLPGSYKIRVSKRNGNQISTKHILKEICRERFPEHTLSKKKQGFGVPIEQWLLKNQGKALQEILLDPLALNRGYFKKQSLERLVQTFIAQKGDFFYPNASGIVGLVTFELWNQRYIDNNPQLL